MSTAEYKKLSDEPYLADLSLLLSPLALLLLPLLQHLLSLRLQLPVLHLQLQRLLLQPGHLLPRLPQLGPGPLQRGLPGRRPQLGLLQLQQAGLEAAVEGPAGRLLCSQGLPQLLLLLLPARQLV